MSRIFRDATLTLAEHHPFARRLVNSGRLSVPAVLDDSPLNTPDRDPFAGAMVPGAPAADAPVITADGPGWLLEQLGGVFNGLYFTGAEGVPEADSAALAALAAGPVPVHTRIVSAERMQDALPAGVTALGDPEGLVVRRYDGRPGSFYLLRPDQHICARWRRLDGDRLDGALARALGREEES
jgi:3-(3-hydroxy-phenyl)propionate hydroxylase